MITMERVSKSYDGGRTFNVTDVSLHVPKGKMLALLGTAGCGKTTTLKMLNRLIEPTSGRVLIDGQNVADGDPVLLRRRIGYVIQGSGLFPHMTVADNIAVVPRLLDWPETRIAARVEELLRMVQLPPDFRTRMPRTLSGGQQQRVGFARALAVEPQVILLDEPFGALDPRTRDTLRDEFLSISRGLNQTMVMVTHDVTEALLSANLIGVMNAGRLLRLGTPQELMTNPGDDFTAEMMSHPRRQTDRLKDLFGDNHRA
jgi:osmoprotectant transport system ATP-binding protein